MLNDFFLYLIQVSVSMAVFALTYRLLFDRLTHFQWNRIYLLASVLFSVLMPLVPTSGLWSTPVSTGLELRFDMIRSGANEAGFQAEEEATQAVGQAQLIAYTLQTLYLLGVLYKSWQLYRSLDAVFRLIQTSPKVEEGAAYAVYVQSDLPTFSFGRSILLNPENDLLTLEEQAQVLLHEEIHVRHRHTLDLLLFELAGVVFWFNPVVHYLHFAIRQVHEYAVDAIVTQTCGTVKSYGYRLLKLTAQNPLPLMAPFSNKQVIRRIQMLTQKPSSPMQKLKFLMVLPVLALSLLVGSCFRNNDRPAFQAQDVKPQKGVSISRLVWKGNTVYSSEQLTDVLGIRPGDLYEKEGFASRLINQAGTDVASLYMDKGYLFFNTEVHEKRVGNAVNLELEVFEGKPANVENVVFKGNKKITTKQLLEMVAVRPGELFNRSKLIQSQKALAESGYFNPTQIGINPLPDIENNTVDLEFTVIEKP
ncbi:POTRA domain-containing protein [Larkinella arboricola]